MQYRQKTWLWISAAVSIVVGIILVLNESGAGWFLVIMGITYLGVSIRLDQESVASNSGQVKRGMFGVALLLFLLALVVSAVLLLK